MLGLVACSGAVLQYDKQLKQLYNGSLTAELQCGSTLATVCRRYAVQLPCIGNIMVAL
jgi:hypothetical protein